MVISTPYRAITLRLDSNCAAAGTSYAAWDAYHATGGWQHIAIFDNTSSDVWDLYDWEQLGRWTWRPGGAWDHSYNDVWQNQPYSDIKIGSWAGVTPTRSGAKVTLNVSAARYAVSLRKFVPSAAAVGQLQYKAPGATKWIALKSVKTSSTGKYTYAYTSTAIRDYRVYFPATNVIWNAASATVRK